MDSSHAPHVFACASIYERRNDRSLLGYGYSETAIGDLMSEILLAEYREINVHLRANMGQFTNWFSFFLSFSFLAAAAFLLLPALRGPSRYGVVIVFLLTHFLAFTGIFIFRRYIGAAHNRASLIARHLNESSESPVPLRFSHWMTDLLAAGFVISYFTWFLMLFL